MIAIIDYGLGNLHSIFNMLRKIGTDVVISSDPNQIAQADKLILPGVGAFDQGISNLRNAAYLSILERRVLEDQVPILGICLGMQLLGKGSEEGVLPGLGWVDCSFKRFKFEGECANMKIPHMGWNYVKIKQPSPLFESTEEQARYYFVHSYHAVCPDPAIVLLGTLYGYSFVSGIQHGNIYGVQFHPEKSHIFGMKLLKNFVERS